MSNVIRANLSELFFCSLIMKPVCLDPQQDTVWYSIDKPQWNGSEQIKYESLLGSLCCSLVFNAPVAFL